jgi:hypothetical protein
MATIIVFASSLFLTVALVIIKAIEIKYNKSNLALELISKLDSKSDKLISDIRFMVLQVIQSVRYIALVQTKAVCKNLLEKVEQKIMEEYRMGHDVFMGRKEIANKGSVSFYLKKITEHKGNEGGGKIEQRF